MILLVGLYLDPSPERFCELLTCIERNAANRNIAGVHVFIEDMTDPKQLVSCYPQLASPNLRLVAHGKRVTYHDFFTYANRELDSQRVMIANADIYFDHTLARLDDYDLRGRLLCLSRWDRQPDGSWSLFEYEMSQDAWIFHTPIPDFSCDFYLGLPGCDNRLAWEAERIGLVLSNPSRSIRAYHLHASNVRRYTETQRVHGAIRGVPAEYLDAVACESRRAEPLAAIAFHETMGYTVGRLELGASSHNNDHRPFTAIPEPLTGRSFTQVVSCSVSTIDVEFLSSGRVYVLIGTDWDGYYVAAAWLGGIGEAEPMSFVETCNRPAFEVWSLLGERGDHFVVPTQVMLVSDHLEQR